MDSMPASNAAESSKFWVYSPLSGLSTPSESAERTVDAERIVVVNHSRSAMWYKYGVSVIGAGLVLIAFFKYWQIDTDTWCFEVRRNG